MAAEDTRPRNRRNGASHQEIPSTKVIKTTKGWPGQVQPRQETTTTYSRQSRPSSESHGGQRAHFREWGTKADPNSNPSPLSWSVGRVPYSRTPTWTWLIKGLRGATSPQVEPASCPVSEEVGQTRRLHTALRTQSESSTHHGPVTQEYLQHLWVPKFCFIVGGTEEGSKERHPFI